MQKFIMLLDFIMEMFVETQKQYFNKMFLVALKLSCQNLHLNIFHIM